MIIVKLTNGFGNNIFQMVAGRLLAEYKNCDLFFIEPFDDYYASEALQKLGFIKHEGQIPLVYKNVNDKTYAQAFKEKKDKPTVLSGYFEDYRYYLPNRQRIIDWFPKVNKTKKCLAVHLRTGDRLFMKNEFYSKPDVSSYKKAIDKFDFDEMHIVTDFPMWKRITEEELSKLKFHTSISKSDSVPLGDSVKYFNSLFDMFEQYNPKHKNGDVLSDFQFIRSCDNILFEHGTLSWWAAFLSDAEKVGVYGPWRPWKGDSNKNLSNVPLEEWFKWE